MSRYGALPINCIYKGYKVDPQRSESCSFEANALIKNCRIQLPKLKTVRINGGPRAQPALAFIVETERSGYEGPKESPGRILVSAKNDEK